MNKNWTELARAERAKSGAKNDDQGAVQTVDEAIVKERLEAAYKKFGEQGVAKLNWTERVLVAQGRIDEVEQ